MYKYAVAIIADITATMADRIKTEIDSEKTEVKKTNSVGDKAMLWVQCGRQGYVMGTYKLCTCLIIL